MSENKINFDPFYPNQSELENTQVYEGAAVGNGLLYEGIMHIHGAVYELVQSLQTPSE